MTATATSAPSIDTGSAATVGAGSTGVNVIPPLSLSGLTTAGVGNDTSTLNPFANLILTDNLPQDSVIANISFTAANGTLNGSGLSAAVVSKGVATYTLSAASPSQLQQELNALAFTPVTHQVSPGLSVTTTFALNFNGGGAAAVSAPLLTLSGSVSGPHALATDSSGDVFVVNKYNNTVEEFSAGGALLNTLSNGISSPVAIATDSSGDVFVANGGKNNTVEEFSPSGGLLQTFGNGISYLAALATDSRGDVFAANAGNNTVEEFSASGVLLYTLSNGIEGAFALATDGSGDVFVANQGNNTIEEFSASGALLQTLSSGVSGPHALATDSGGDVFVANDYNNTVEEFSASGVLLNTLSNGLYYPSYLTTDSSGDVFVSNQGNDTVEEFSASGILLRTLNNASGPLATDSVGDMWVNNLNNNTEAIYAPIPATYALSNNATTITITAEAFSPPSINTGSAATVVAGFTSAINSLSITDNWAGGGVLQVTLSDSQGLLNASASGVTVSGANSDKLKLSGALSAINSALASLTDTNAALGADAINVSVANISDGLSASASQSINVVPPLTPSGLTTAEAGSDVGTLNPFAQLILTDNLPQDSVSASISFTAANGTLSGSGLSAATLSNGLAAYTLNAVSPGQLQQELNALVFTPTAHQVSPGLSLSTNFTLNFSGGDAGAPNPASYTLSNDAASVQITAAAVTAPSINIGAESTVIAGNAGPINGLSITDASAGGGDLQVTLSDSQGLLNAAAGGVTVSGANSNKITLSGALSAINSALASLTDTNAALGADAIGISVTDNGDGLTASANQNVNVIPPLTLSGLTTAGAGNDVSQLNPFAHLVLTDHLPQDSVSAGISFTAANGILSGSGLSAATLSNGLATYTLNAASPNQLRQELNALAFTPAAHQVSAGQSVTTDFSLDFNGGGAAAVSAPLLTLSSGVSGPWSLATDSSGDVWVANYNSATNLSSVEEFSSSGVLLRTLNKGVSFPYALTIDKGGDVWVANAYNNNVEEFSASGVLLRTLSTGVSFPVALAIDNGGNVWVANSNNNTVEEFSSSGGLLQTLSNIVSVPSALAIDNGGNVWVANGVNNTVEEFSSLGVLLQTLSNGASFPDALATDSNGNVFVTYPGDNAIAEFSASGALLRTLSEGVSHPWRLAIDSGGNVFVSNQGNNAIEEFSASGALLNTLSNGVSGPQALTADNRGDVWVANWNNNTVTEYAPQIPASYTLGNNATQITVTAVAPPSVNVAASLSIPSDATSAINGISIIDAAAGKNTLSVTLSDHTGLLNVTVASGLAVTGANSANLTLSGDLSAINLALTTLSDTTTVLGSDPIAITVADHNAGLSGQASQPVTVAANHPLIRAAAENIPYNTATAITGLKMIDDSAGTGSISVKLSDSYGKLNISPEAGLSEKGANSKTLTLTGGVAAVDQALATLTDLNKHLGADPISINVADAVTGLSNSGSESINIAKTPVLSVGHAQTLVADAAQLIKGLSLADRSAGGNTLTLTLSDNHGLLNGGFSGLNVSGANTTSLSLSGNLATLNAALKTLTDYNPVSGADPIQISVIDTGSGLSAGKAQAINVLAAPQINAAGYNAQTGVFSIAGANLQDQITHKGVQLADFTFNVGGASHVFNAHDKIGHLTAAGFTLTLSATDRAGFNQLLAGDGAQNASGVAYQLNAVPGWDGGAGLAANQTVNISGLNVLTPGTDPIITNLTTGGGQLELPKADFSALQGLSAVSSANFANAPQAVSAQDYLYYVAGNGGLYYDAGGSTTPGAAVEIAVIGANSHPHALSPADFKLF